LNNPSNCGGPVASDYPTAAYIVDGIPGELLDSIPSFPATHPAKHYSQSP
jgi:hypothetical protein